LVNALVKLNDFTNKILNIVKIQHDFKDKSKAIDYVVEKYAEKENISLINLKAKKLTVTEILDILEKNKKKIKALSVTKLGLFGSYAKDQQKKDSDLDFIVALKNPTFDNYMELKFLLEDLFNKKIDLVMEGALKPGIKYVKNEAKYVKGL